MEKKYVQFAMEKDAKSVAIRENAPDAREVGKRVFMLMKESRQRQGFLPKGREKIFPPLFCKRVDRELRL